MKVDRGIRRFTAYEPAFPAVLLFHRRFSSKVPADLTWHLGILQEASQLRIGTSLPSRPSDFSWNCGTATAVGIADELDELLRSALRERSAERPVAEVGYLGLVVERESRRIRRPSVCRSEVHLTAGRQWHFFQRLFEAGENGGTYEIMKSGYPSDWSTRHDGMNQLRKSLGPLKVGISDARIERLKLIPLETSDTSEVGI